MSTKIHTQQQINKELQDAADSIMAAFDPISRAASMAAQNKEWNYAMCICHKAISLQESYAGVLGRINREPIANK